MTPTGSQTSSPVPFPFTGAPIDRVSARRKDPEWLRRQAEDPTARAVAAGPDGVLVTDGELVRLALGALGTERPGILLGLEEGRPLFACELGALPDLDGGRVVSLREAGSALPHEEAGLAAYLAALLNWHRAHGHCANCGSPTGLDEGGHSRRCPSCGASHFPRTDPVVIMSVEHDGRLLLGRRTGAPEGRVSVLAGFVSPGESAEEAVVREVWEESGIVVRDPVFVSSQPWPFPASLMLGFHALADGGEPVPRDGELEEVRWVARELVAAATLQEGRFRLPPPVSIARYLIERWLRAGA